jgi:potassium-transporting ATPase KdpC subunit
MRRALVISLRMALVTVALTGVIYPLAVRGVGALLFPHQADGSLITGQGGAVIGSRLIGQPFTSEKYFHSRLSVAGPDGYDAMASGASNLGPTSRTLFARVESSVAEVERTDGVAHGAVPVDMVTASASGLDPDISPDNARAQAARVATVRGLSVEMVRHLVETHVRGRDLGFLGEARVNVLELNLALDGLAEAQGGGGRP